MKHCNALITTKKNRYPLASKKKRIKLKEKKKGRPHLNFFYHTRWKHCTIQGVR